MVGKPKAFFIQSCRGEAYQETMVQPDNDEEEDDAEKFRVPTDGDIFIAYSTTEGKHDQFRIFTVTQLTQYMFSNRYIQLQIPNYIL